MSTNGIIEYNAAAMQELKHDMDLCRSQLEGYGGDMKNYGGQLLDAWSENQALVDGFQPIMDSFHNEFADTLEKFDKLARAVENALERAQHADRQVANSFRA